MRKIVLCYVVMCFCGQFQEIVALEAATPAQTEYKELYDGLQWVFERGAPMYYAGFDGDENEFKTTLKDEIKKKYAEENPDGSLWKISNTYSTKDEPCPLYFGISAYTPTSDGRRIKLMHIKSFVIDIQDTVLEYWVAYIYGRRERISFFEDTDIYWETNLFIITQADNLESSRKIVKEETQYFRTAEIGGRTIEFPEDNLEALLALGAWHYPSSFKDSDLKNYKIIGERYGELIKEKLRWIDTHPMPMAPGLIINSRLGKSFGDSIGIGLNFFNMWGNDVYLVYNTGILFDYYFSNDFQARIYANIGLLTLFSIEVGPSFIIRRDGSNIIYGFSPMISATTWYLPIMLNKAGDKGFCPSLYISGCYNFFNDSEYNGPEFNFGMKIIFSL